MIGTSRLRFATMLAGILAPLLLFVAAVGAAAPALQPISAAGAEGASSAVWRQDAVPARLPAERTAVAAAGAFPYILSSAPGLAGAALPADFEPLPGPARAAPGLRPVISAAGLRLPLAYRPQAPPA